MLNTKNANNANLFGPINPFISSRIATANNTYLRYKIIKTKILKSIEIIRKINFISSCTYLT